MEYELEPEPEPHEREALVQALDRLLDSDTVPLPYRSLWRESGIRENVEAF